MTISLKCPQMSIVIQVIVHFRTKAIGNRNIFAHQN